MRLTSLFLASALLTGGVACSADENDNSAAGNAAPQTTMTPRAEPIPLMEFDDAFELKPGSTYVIDPDGDATTPLRVTYTVDAEGWTSWIGAAKFNNDGHVGLSITTVDNLVRDACRDQTPANPPVGPTVDDLATALTNLAPFVVSAPPTAVTVHGYHGTHLELTVPNLPIAGQRNYREFTECTDGELHSWIAKNLGGSFWGYNGEPGRTEQFWILDVNGTRLVLETNYSPESPQKDVAELHKIFDSIQIHP